MSTADDRNNQDNRELVLRTVSLGGSALSRALQQGRDHGWMTERPHGVTAWREHGGRIRGSFHGHDWLAPLMPAFAPMGAARERLERAAAGGIVVTTGQQPGLFGGPLYTLSKAIGAIAFADILQDALQIPVAPVFWAATDDADWREAAVTHFSTPRGLLTASLKGPATEGVAMAEIPLGDLTAAWAALDASCGSAADHRVRHMLESAYFSEHTIGGAYLTLLRSLLEPLGMAVLDAAHPAVREAADPVLRIALERASAIEDALVARNQAITAAGFSPQVEHVESRSLVFQRMREEHGFGVRERVPVAHAERVAQEAACGAFGPNVLLRPIVERALLPTATYLAGPGELAYFAQVSAVAESMGVAAPIASPRFACELMDVRHLRRLADLGLSESDLLTPDHAEQLLARTYLPEQAGDALERLRVTLDAQIRSLGEAIQGEAIVAPEVLAGLTRDVSHRVGRFERRLLAGIKRREAGIMREVAVLRGAIRPNGHSPERVINPMPFLARHGISVLERMRACARPYATALLEPADTP